MSPLSMKTMQSVYLFSIKSKMSHSTTTTSSFQLSTVRYEIRSVWSVWHYGIGRDRVAIQILGEEMEKRESSELIALTCTIVVTALYFLLPKPKTS